MTRQIFSLHCYMKNKNIKTFKYFWDHRIQVKYYNSLYGHKPLVLTPNWQESSNLEFICMWEKCTQKNLKINQKKCVSQQFPFFHFNTLLLMMMAHQLLSNISSFNPQPYLRMTTLHFSSGSKEVYICQSGLKICLMLFHFTNSQFFKYVFIHLSFFHNAKSVFQIMQEISSQRYIFSSYCLKMFNVRYGIHRKMWLEQLMTSLLKCSPFFPLFQQPVKIIVLAASKNLECSLKEKDKYIFCFQTVYEITNANNFYCSCILPTYISGKHLSCFGFCFELEKLS